MEGTGEQLSFGAKSVIEPKTSANSAGRKPFARTKSAPRDARFNDQFSPSNTNAAAKTRKRMDRSNPV